MIDFNLKVNLVHVHEVIVEEKEDLRGNQKVEANKKKKNMKEEEEEEEENKIQEIKKEVIVNMIKDPDLEVKRNMNKNKRVINQALEMIKEKGKEDLSQNQKVNQDKKSRKVKNQFPETIEEEKEDTKQNQKAEVKVDQAQILIHKNQIQDIIRKRNIKIKNNQILEANPNQKNKEIQEAFQVQEIQVLIVQVIVTLTD